VTTATTSRNGVLTPGQHAAAEFLAGHWPEGNRNNAAGALAGGLLRAGWAVETVEHFVEAVAEEAGDDESHKRVERVGETAEKIKNGEKATGFPKLAQLTACRARSSGPSSHPPRPTPPHSWRKRWSPSGASSAAPRTSPSRPTVTTPTSSP
jgi:hypothetical protein